MKESKLIWGAFFIVSVLFSTISVCYVSKQMPSIQTDTYMGVSTTLIGIMAAFVIGFQIYNALELKKEIRDEKSESKKISEELKGKIDLLQNINQQIDLLKKEHAKTEQAVIENNSITVDEINNLKAQIDKNQKMTKSIIYLYKCEYELSLCHLMDYLCVDIKLNMKEGSIDLDSFYGALACCLIGCCNEYIKSPHKYKQNSSYINILYSKSQKIKELLLTNYNERRKAISEIEKFYRLINNGHFDVESLMELKTNLSVEYSSEIDVFRSGEFI